MYNNDALYWDVQALVISNVSFEFQFLNQNSLPFYTDCQVNR